MNRQIIDAALSEVYTTLPGVIVDYDGVTATVRPALPKQLANGDILAAPLIARVPIHWLVADGAAAQITVPLKPGDPVTLHFSCRSIEGWLSGSDGPPDDPRQFDLTDCFATPVMRPGPRADTENVCVRYGAGVLTIAPDGSTQLDAPLFTVNAPTIINGHLTFTKGLTGSGSDEGGTDTMQINGNLDFQGGTITHDGVPIDKTHTHSGVESGPDNSGPPNP